MPKIVSDIHSGVGFQRSSDNGKNLADAQTRVFRIILNDPSEVIDVQKEVGVKIGDVHPVNSNLYCTSWDAKYEGDSRTVVIATFNYQSTPSAQGQDRNEQPPDIRPANWSTSTTIMEVPAQSWVEVGQNNLAAGNAEAPINPAKDRVEGISSFDALVTISIEQYCVDDPTEHCLYAGSVNKEVIRVGSLTCQPGSVMFRGVQAKPTIESFGDLFYRGWTATYEFAYRPNYVKGISSGNGTYDGNIGWDIAVPQTGFNIINKSAALGGGVHEIGSLVLQHGSDGKIANWPDDPDLATGTEDKKVRAMVLVHAYADGGGASQLPCAQPIPLNDDGTPRAITANPPVKVRRYRTNREVNFTNTFGLRLL